MGPLGPERHPAAPRSASWRPRRFRPPRTTLPRPHQLHSGGHGDTVSRETPAAQGERRLVSGVRGDATYRSRAHPSNDRSRPRESRAPPRIDLGPSVAMKRPRAALRQPGAPPRASRRAFVSTRAAFACRGETLTEGHLERIRRRDPTATAPPASTLPGAAAPSAMGGGLHGPSPVVSRSPACEHPCRDFTALDALRGATKGVWVWARFPLPAGASSSSRGSTRLQPGDAPPRGERLPATGCGCDGCCRRERRLGVRPQPPPGRSPTTPPKRQIGVTLAPTPCGRSPSRHQRDRGFHHLPVVGPTWAPASVVRKPEPARPRGGRGAVRLGPSRARNYPLKTQTLLSSPEAPGQHRIQG